MFRRGSMLALLTVIVAASPASLAIAQDDAEIVQLANRARKFLEGLGADPDAAFKDFLADSDLSDSEEVQRLTAAAKELPGKYGDFVAAELIETQRVGEDLVLLTYLYKSDRFPLVWRFAFYRPRETWGVVSLQFDSKLLALRKFNGER